MTKNKILFWTSVVLADLVLTIGVWELVRDDIVALIPDNTVQYVRQEPVPTTVDGIIEDRAKSWLKSTEAFDIAKERVTKDLVEELSKL